MATYVISLGGSLIVPGKIDVQFLKAFNTFIRKRVSKGDRFVLICGGGYTCRQYQQAAAAVGAKVAPQDLDWLGIHATRLNGHLLRTVFRDIAYPKVIKNPANGIPHHEKIVVAAGWKPGRSTDNIAALVARRIGSRVIINMSNIDYVYDKDPVKSKDAKPVKSMSWKVFRKLVGSAWDPGMNLPFDPIAAKVAEKEHMKVFVIGKDLKNLENVLDSKACKGTVIA